MLITYKPHFSIISKLIITYILNCIDLLFTYTLLKTGLFYEINNLMTPFLSSSLISFFIKVIIPAVFLFSLFSNHGLTPIGLFSKYDLESEPELPVWISHSIVNILLFIYIAITASHIYYLCSVARL